MTINVDEANKNYVIFSVYRPTKHNIISSKRSLILIREYLKIFAYL